MKYRVKLLAVAFVATLGGGAGGQVPDVAIARQLAIQGVEAVEAGNCNEGVTLLERAEQMHHAPVHLLYIARCRLREGRLVMATELWRQIVREGAPAAASPALVSAVAEANTQLGRTLPRLARTTLRTTSAYPGLELRLDGALLPEEVLGGSQLLDPGPHELTATAPGYAPWQRGWTLAEGGNAEIAVTLAPAAGGSGPGPGPAVASGDERGGNLPPWLGTAGWITASAGAAALIGGTVALLARNSRRNELEELCPNKTCPMSDAELEDRKDSIVGLTTASTILMFGGGALFAGGVTLIVLDKTSGSSGNTAIMAGSPGTLGGLTFRGSF